jgi:hypothetical protein
LIIGLAVISSDFARVPIASAELADQSQFIDKDGDLRTHPAMSIGSETGLDGFFAARVVARESPQRF